MDKDTQPRLVRTYAPDIERQLATLERLLGADLADLLTGQINSDRSHPMTEQSGPPEPPTNPVAPRTAAIPMPRRKDEASAANGDA